MKSISRSAPPPALFDSPATAALGPALKARAQRLAPLALTFTLTLLLTACGGGGGGGDTPPPPAATGAVSSGSLIVPAGFSQEKFSVSWTTQNTTQAVTLEVNGVKVGDGNSGTVSVTLKPGANAWALKQGSTTIASGDLQATCGGSAFVASHTVCAPSDWAPLVAGKRIGLDMLTGRVRSIDIKSATEVVFGEFVNKTGFTGGSPEVGDCGVYNKPIEKEPFKGLYAVSCSASVPAVRKDFVLNVVDNSVMKEIDRSFIPTGAIIKNSYGSTEIDMTYFPIGVAYAGQYTKTSFGIVFIREVDSRLYSFDGTLVREMLSGGVPAADRFKIIFSF